MFTPMTAVIAFMLGAAVGPGLFFLMARMDRFAEPTLYIGVGAFIAVGLCLSAGAIAAFWLLPRIFRNATGTIQSIVTELSSAINAHRVGNEDEAFKRAENAAIEASAWYTNYRTRHFISRASIALIVAFGGLAGTVLLVAQNALLREQNDKLELQTKLLNQQTVTAEAQRRGPLTTELFDILKDVAKEASEHKGENKFELSPGLANRVRVFTISAQPYLYVRFKRHPQTNDNVAEIIATPLSPERGLLLIGLAAYKVKLSSIRGANFTSSDLRGVDLEGADLRELDFSDSDFSDSYLAGADFQDGRFFRVTFDGANLRRANFEDVLMHSSSFKEAHVEGTKFVNSSVEKCDFHFAKIFDKRTPEYKEPDELDMTSFNRGTSGEIEFLRSKSDTGAATPPNYDAKWSILGIKNFR